MSEVMHKGWHWPSFDKVLCGTVTDRERMGMPDHYAPARFDDGYTLVYERLRRSDTAALVGLCENAAAPLVERMVAGNLLAATGDPRIRTLSPEMIRVPPAMVALGLRYSDVDSVLTAYSGLGLDRQWIAKECPQYIADINAFGIAKYPVTNLEYRDFLLATGFAELPTSWAFRRFPQERANHPVYTVSADAADAYCHWLAAETSQAFRLPTEAEWEYCAGGPAGTEFPWGNAFCADFANTAESGLFETTAVGIFSRGHSVFGVADLAGNVEEYVADAYGPYAGGEVISDHLSKLHPHYRVARGGSFARFRDLARTRRRHGHNPRSGVYVMGFRIAET